MQVLRDRREAFLRGEHLSPASSAVSVGSSRPEAPSVLPDSSLLKAFSKNMELNGERYTSHPKPPIPSKPRADGSGAYKSNSTQGSIAASGGSNPLPVPAAQPAPNAVRIKEVEGYVGFANLPNQVYRKSVKSGFDFTLMFVGETGLGKSTLINSLFLTDIYSAEYPGPTSRTKKTVKVDKTQVLLKENGVNLRLTVVDTPGFGDAVDNSDCWQPVIEYIEQRYEEYLNAESRVQRTQRSLDGRVHCCLYFIAPTGHGLKPLDIEFMTRLHGKVNIVPVISKADTLTPDEIRDFKRTIINEVAQHKIKIYNFPELEDEEDNRAQRQLKDRVPFAVVGSNCVVDVGGHRVRARQYPWGVVEVENLDHNDFVALRNMVVRTHMQDLIDVTNNVHYENYRYSKLAPTANAEGVKPAKTALAKDPLTQMEEERQEHEDKMKRMEAEMEEVFEMKVKEKMKKLQESEIDLERRAEQLKRSLEHSRRELDEKRLLFERERTQWGEVADKRATVDSRDCGVKTEKKLKTWHSIHVTGGDKHGTKKDQKKKSIF